jgi:hypothetical protein
MSDLRYYITAVTKGKKPKVMFLTPEGYWNYDARDAKLADLHDSKNAARHEPTHCVFVEANDGLCHSLNDFFEKNDRISCNGFTELAKNLHCKTVSTRKEKKPKTQAAPEVQDAPAPKKRVVYTLYCREGYYSNYDNPQIRIDGRLADVYRTPEDAQFVADIRNLDGGTNFGWQVKKHEIEF